MKEIEIDKGFDDYRPYTSKCGICEHFDSVTLTCKAYPEVIPKRFLSGEKVHLTVQRDQTGNTVLTKKSGS